MKKSSGTIVAKLYVNKGLLFDELLDASLMSKKLLSFQVKIFQQTTAHKFLNPLKKFLQNFFTFVVTQNK